MAVAVFLFARVVLAGEPETYKIETIPVPKEIILEVGGMDFTPDGTLMISTRRGEVWALKGDKWNRFTTGLHEPLGMVAAGNGDIYVVQRPELTHLKDTNGDGVADSFETVSSGWGVSGNYHEFSFGPVRDKEGNFWGTLNLAHGGPNGFGAEMSSNVPWRGWSFKVTPKGEFVPMSVGLRSPNGIGINPDGDVFFTDNQGGWVGTSFLAHITKGAFHGHPGGLVWDKSLIGDPSKLSLEELNAHRKRPAVLIPQSRLANSPSQPLWDNTNGKFGPFAGQCFLGDQTSSKLMRIALEKIGGEYQGAIFPFKLGFQSGINRLAFAKDGSLWVGETDRGWGSAGGKPYGLQRVVWNGKVPMEIHTMKLTKQGFDLNFTRPVDPVTAGNPDAYSIQRYYYLYHPQYGSPETELTIVKPTEVKISDDKKRVSLIIPDLVKERLYELHIQNLKAADGSPLQNAVAYYTLNRLVP